MADVLTVALTLAAAGCSVIPVTPGGAKAPAVAWKPYTAERATTEQIHAWHDAGILTGIGVVCGAVSGNLEMAELEGRAVTSLDDLRDLADASGLADLWHRATTGWAELSPMGGVHYLYRVEGPVPGNTKLARTADRLVLAETRGEGGYVVVAPTDARHHTTGMPWVTLAGGPDTVPTLTSDEREAFLTLFRTLDETPPPPDAPRAATALPRSDSPDGLRPGDDYENRVDWTDILGPHGWTLAYQHGTTRYWRRPDKHDPGISATTGRAADRDRLYVFSSSTVFEPEHPYTKLGAYALLEHNGDHTAAARDLRRQGYGGRDSTGGLVGLGIVTTPTEASPWPTPGSVSSASLEGTPVAPTATRPSTTGHATPTTSLTASMTAVSSTATAPPTEGALATVHQLPVEPEPHTSWWPRDLTAVLEGREEEPPPAFLARQDGHRLFYAAKVNGLIGESENGKSWIAQYATLQALQEGHNALYLDFEDTAPGVVARLRALGATDTNLTHLAYISPDEMLHHGAKTDLEQALLDQAPRLVILDGFNAAMTLLGLDLESNTDATKFAQMLLVPLSRTGAAVVYVDHVPKNKEARGKGGIGAQAKRAMTTGCTILCETEKEFGRGMTGRLKLTVDKDRPGHVRAVSAAAKNAGVAVLESRPDGSVRVVIEAPDLRSRDERGSTRPTVLMERVSLLLEALAPDGASKNAIEKQVTGNAEYVRKAVDHLIGERYAKVEPGARGAVIVTSTRPYREASDGLITPTSSTSSDLVSTSSETKSSAQRATSSVPPLPYGGGRGQPVARADQTNDDLVQELTDASSRILDAIRAERDDRW